MPAHDKIIALSSEMTTYLEYEAKRRGTSIEDVYAKEMANQELSRREAFTRQELQALAETSQPRPRLLQGDEECSF